MQIFTISNLEDFTDKWLRTTSYDNTTKTHWEKSQVHQLTQDGLQLINSMVSFIGESLYMFNYMIYYQWITIMGLQISCENYTNSSMMSSSDYDYLWQFNFITTPLGVVLNLTSAKKFDIPHISRYPVTYWILLYWRGIVNEETVLNYAHWSLFILTVTQVLWLLTCTCILVNKCLSYQRNYADWSFHHQLTQQSTDAIPFHFKSMRPTMPNTWPTQCLT